MVWSLLTRFEDVLNGIQNGQRSGNSDTRPVNTVAEMVELEDVVPEPALSKGREK